MSAPPPLTPFTPPPLPSGWTEHIGLTGHSYYYNTQTKESTYVRPLPSFLNLPPLVTPKKRKEKPLIKTPIPGTDWLRVTTSERNVFYSHKAKKESFWVVPEEIRDAVSALEKEEAAKKGQGTYEQEIERVKAEVQELVKRKAELVVSADEAVAAKKVKVHVDKEGHHKGGIKAEQEGLRGERGEEQEQEEGDEEEEGDDEEAGGEEEEGDEENAEDEGWQREAAQQLAREVAEGQERVQEEEEIAQEGERKAGGDEKALSKKAKEFNMPTRVDLSLDEAKALFKTLLREKDINPLHPWDTSLPLFISDPRYVLLPSVSIRREVFDEYCRERARELRESNVRKEKEALDPKEAFVRLLQEEVKSTRASWTDFRRAWKKDRRFWGWGRDDREREKRFRDFVKGLGEKKRAAAQKAETEFFALLRESGSINPESGWKDVKREIYNDPRYDAVGSSTLREDLFNAFVKANAASVASTMRSTGKTSSNRDEEMIEPADEQERSRRKKEKAVKEREEKVKADRNRVEADIERSRIGLDKGEAELEFRTLLIDAIRDPKSTWDAALPELRTDPRFTRSPLSVVQRRHLFHVHIAQLRSKHLINLSSLFETHTTSLATTFSSLPLQSLLASFPATKLGLGLEELEREFEMWQRERTTQARKEFDQMLSENPFVEFWGRLGKIGGEGVDGGVKADDLGEDEGEGGGGTVDMKVLAKSVDIADMVKVLQNDRRYIMFDHVPEQRVRWIRGHISQLPAPKLSVHVPETFL